MKKTLFLLTLFFTLISLAQNQEKNNSGLKPLDTKFREKSTNLDTLDTFMIKKEPKKELVLAKNYLYPKSDSYYDIAEYIIRKQFQDKPVYSWILTIVFVFWLLRTIKGLF